mmetsp:Transcript_13404/g.37074  ORF Transcript_13404/g.37074 Transcript_13404/m.37074 type:complete len:240 (-) Transcript_13404:952-1671(-)
MTKQESVPYSPSSTISSIWMRCELPCTRNVARNTLPLSGSGGEMEGTEAPGSSSVRGMALCRATISMGASHSRVRRWQPLSPSSTMELLARDRVDTGTPAGRMRSKSTFSSRTRCLSCSISALSAAILRPRSLGSVRWSSSPPAVGADDAAAVGSESRTMPATYLLLAGLFGSFSFLLPRLSSDAMMPFFFFSSTTGFSSGTAATPSSRTFSTRLDAAGNGCALGSEGGSVVKLITLPE